LLHLFLTHLTGYKKIAIRSPLLIVLEVLCELALPLVMAEIVDVAIPTGNVAYIFTLGAAMAILAALAMLCGSLAAKYSAYSSQGFGANLRQELFEKVQEFSFADIDKFSSASLITRMTNDVNAMTMMLAMGLRMLVRAPVMLITALCVTLYLNWRLAMVLVIIIPIMALAVALIMRVATQLYRTLQMKIDNLNNTVQENLVGIRVVKAFVRENFERTKFKKSNNDLTDASLRVGMRISVMMPVITLCLNTATVFVLYFGGQMVMNGSFLLGSLSAFINYISQVLMSVMMVAIALLQLSRAQACAARIQEVLHTEPSIQEEPQSRQASLPAPKGKIQYENVSFKYQTDGSGDNVLSNLSFTVEPGRFVAIVGGTGTGKTSLVNLLPRFYDVTEGRILVDGMDVRDYPVDELRRRIGMVLQTNILFTGTVRENLLWGDMNATEEDLIRCTKDAQAYDFIQTLPDGFDTELAQGGVNLSGGQKQRLCIARAMLKKPAILILDDSTSAVDSATESAIRESFHTNLKDATVFIIAQRISSVQYADEILVLDDDHIAGSGTHDELMASCKVYQEIYQSQQEEVMES